MIVDVAGVVKNILVNPGFGLEMILVGSLGVSGPCTLHISCGT